MHKLMLVLAEDTSMVDAYINEANIFDVEIVL